MLAMVPSVPSIRARLQSLPRELYDQIANEFLATLTFPLDRVDTVRDLSSPTLIALLKPMHICRKFRKRYAPVFYDGDFEFYGSLDRLLRWLRNVPLQYCNRIHKITWIGQRRAFPREETILSRIFNLWYEGMDSSTSDLRELVRRRVHLDLAAKMFFKPAELQRKWPSNRRPSDWLRKGGPRGPSTGHLL